MNLSSTSPSAHDVFDFWFGDGLQRDWPSNNRQALWFGGDAKQDETIRHLFGVLGRESSAEERAFLEDGPRYGQ